MSKPRPSMRDQLFAAYKVQKKARDAEGMVYYNTRGEGVVACASWADFKGSWAYQQWVKRPEVVEMVTNQRDSLRFQW